jgi:hypothetical protein
MKSFKKFLMEEVSSASVGLGTTPQQNSQGQPKGSQPSVAQVDLPVSDDERDRTPPDPIDWGELDDRIQDMIEQFESILRMLGMLSWDQFTTWLWYNYGIDITEYDSGGAWGFLSQWYEDQLKQWFENNYRNPTADQRSTFEHRLLNLDDRLRQLWEQHTNPSTPGSPNPYLPLGGADDDRYRPMDINDPNTWHNFDPNNLPWWAPRPPNNQDDPRKPYPGVYQA